MVIQLSIFSQDFREKSSKMVIRALNNHNDRETKILITIYILVIYIGRKLEHNFIKMSNKFTTFIFFL